MEIIVQNGGKRTAESVGSDGSGQVELLGLFLEVFSDSDPANFGSLVGFFFLGFEADIGVIKQVKNCSFFFSFPANDKGKLIFYQFSFSGEVDGFTDS